MGNPSGSTMSGAPAAPARPAASILVAAAVIIEGGRVLLTQRKRGTHLEGAWEFPGGKVEPGEDPREALARELREEIGIESAAGEIVDVTFHRYPEKSVLLLFFRAERAPGSPDPRAVDVADVRWAAIEDLRDEIFPAADVAILAKVRRMLEDASPPIERRAVIRGGIED